MSAISTIPERRLSEVCEIVSGATPRRDHPEYWDGDIAWVTPKDIRSLEGPVLADTPEKITLEGYESCSTRLLPVSSVLFSSRAPIGLVAITGREMCTNQGFKSLIPGPEVDAGYLYWCLRREGPRIADRSSGTTFSEISRKGMEQVKIPLPPLPEQRRIAAILDKADAVRRKRQQTIDLADQFLRSAFLDLFGDPVTNPKCWPVKKLGDILTDIEGGWSAKGEDRTPQPGEKAVLKISAVTSGVYRPEECKVVTDLGGRDVIVPRLGDVLFSRANTRELVAATCLVDREASDVFLPDKLWRLVPNGELIRGAYLRFALSSESLRGLIRRLATGTSGSMLNVSKAKLRSLPIPIPSLPQQEHFERLLSSHQSLVHIGQEVAGTCETLAQSLTQRAFRGDT